MDADLGDYLKATAHIPTIMEPGDKAKQVASAFKTVFHISSAAWVKK